MAKIYTKTGDAGMTGLFGGKRLPKSDLRIDTYGTVDELNSWLGLMASYDLNCIDKTFFQKIQSDLFNIGSVLASNPEKDFQMPNVSQSDIELIEQAIDKGVASLPELKAFILPGGSVQASNCHIARTVCRRSERKLVQLNESEKIDTVMIMYLNRLSDYLFVLARLILQEQKLPEVLWKS